MRTLILLTAVSLFSISLHAQGSYRSHRKISGTDTVDFSIDTIAHPGQYVDNLPNFKGDLNQYIKKQLHYPADAKKKNITGTVTVEFAVDESGDISDVHVTYSVYPSLDAEAIRLVKAMPPLNPAMLNNAPVKAGWWVYVPFN